MITKTVNEIAIIRSECPLGGASLPAGEKGEAQGHDSSNGAMISQQTNDLGERLAQKRLRVEACQNHLNGGGAFAAEIVSERLDTFDKLLGCMKPTVRGRMIETIESIAHPSAEFLEANGQFARRVAQLKNFPDVKDSVMKLINERYWLEDADGEDSDKMWDPKTYARRKHHMLERAFYSGDETAFNAESTHRMLSLLDPDIRALINKIELPKESEGRQRLREALEQQGIHTFGNDCLVHNNHRGLTGEIMFTQKALENLAFAGHLELEGPGDKPVITNFSAPGADWKSLDQLHKVLSNGGPEADRIRDALYRAGRKDGCHVIGDLQEHMVVEIFGLDNSLYFAVASRPGGDQSEYGQHELKIPVKAIPDAVVALCDAVMLTWEEHPDAIPRYAFGLMSIEQYQEMVLDHAYLDESGVPHVNWPKDLEPFGFNDPRLEVQIRGCISLR